MSEKFGTDFDNNSFESGESNDNIKDDTAKESPKNGSQEQNQVSDAEIDIYTIKVKATRNSKKRKKSNKRNKSSVKDILPSNADIPVILPPEEQSKELIFRLLGYFFKAVVIWLSVYGLTLFLADGFNLGNTQNILYISLICVAYLSAMYYSKLTFLIGSLGLIGGGVFIYLNFVKGDFFHDIYLSVMNGVYNRLIKLGYYSLSQNLRVLNSPYNGSELLTFGFIIFIFVLSLVFVFSLQKKTKIILPAIFSFLIISVIFTYNIVKSAFPTALIISAFVGVIVMYLYDRRYNGTDKDFLHDVWGKKSVRQIKLEELKSVKTDNVSSEKVKVGDKERTYTQRATSTDELDSILKKEKIARTKKRAKKDKSYRKINIIKFSSAGFAGIFASGLVLFVLLIPALSMEKNFVKIGFLDKYFSDVRQYVTAMLRGDDPIMDDLGYRNEASNFTPRNTEASARIFSGEKIFHVETQYATPIYLRGWVGTEYDSGAWYSGTGEVLEEYRRVFGSEFRPETMMYNFYKLVNPSTVNTTNYLRNYQNNTKFGFLTMQINLKRVGGSGNLVYMPSYSVPNIGLLNFNTSEPSEYSYINFFDGIYTGRKFLPGAEYATVAYVTTLRNEKFMDNLSKEIVEYNIARNHIDLLNKKEEEIQYQDMLLEFREEAIANEIAADPYVELLNTYLIKTDLEKQEINHAFFVESLYAENVYDNYSKPADSKLIDDLQNELMEGLSLYAERLSYDANVYLERHAAVMRVINHLRYNFEYTLTPTVVPDPNLDPIENFLFYTKEGYCVQYASAATLLLRAAGIPARYVEGFVVSDYYRNHNSDNRYFASVHDYNAHAWVEVYYDGVGWIQYEATAPFMADMYDELKSNVSGNTSNTTPPPEEEDEEEVEIDWEELERLARLEELRILRIKIAVASGVLLLVVGAMIFLISRSKKKQNARKELMDAVIKGEINSTKEFYRDESRRVIDITREMLVILALVPNPGEFTESFANRIGESFPQLKVTVDVNKAIEGIQKEEFGGGMENDELIELAKLYLKLHAISKKELSFFSKLKLKFITNKI